MATNGNSLSANILAGCLARTFGKPPEDSAPEVEIEQERIPTAVGETHPRDPVIIPFGMIQQNPAGDDEVHSSGAPAKEREFNQVRPANEKPAFERLEPGFRVTEFMPAAQVVAQKPLSNKPVAPYAVLQGMGDSAFTLTFSGGGSGATASLVLAQDGLLPEARFESGLCHISPQRHGDMAEESRNGVSPTAEIRKRDRQWKRFDAIGAGVLLFILAAFLGAYFKPAPSASKAAAPVAAIASAPDDPAMPKAATEDATAAMPQAPVTQQDATDPPTKPEKKSKKRKLETLPKDVSLPPSPMGLGAFAGAAPAPVPAPAPTPTLAAMRPEEYKPAAPSARIHEQTSMTLTEIVPSGTGKTVAWFYDRGAQVPLKEGDRLPGSGGVIRKINVAKGSVTVSDNGVETMFFVGKL